jgi:hypothetical protein
MEQSKYCMFGILLALLHWQARKNVKLEQDLKYKKFNILGPPFRWNTTPNLKLNSWLQGEKTPKYPEIMYDVLPHL